MTTIRISGNWRNPNKMEWAGAPSVDDQGRIERSIELPEEAFQALEREIAKGGLEGFVFLKDGTRFDWFLDRSLARSASTQPGAPPSATPEAAPGAAELREPLWASLHLLRPEVEAIAQGAFTGTERERQVIQLLARVVLTEMKRHP